VPLPESLDQHFDQIGGERKAMRALYSFNLMIKVITNLYSWTGREPPHQVARRQAPHRASGRSHTGARRLVSVFSSLPSLLSESAAQTGVRPAGGCAAIPRLNQRHPSSRGNGHCCAFMNARMRISERWLLARTRSAGERRRFPFIEVAGQALSSRSFPPIRSGVCADNPQAVQTMRWPKAATGNRIVERVNIHQGFVVA
jgi:hypothetical protein